MCTPIPIHINFFLKCQDLQKGPLEIGGAKLIHHSNELAGKVSLSSLGLAGHLLAYLKSGL